jgi:hypothetical protein
VWEATVEGRKLNFHLAGINNQNFIMQDEETGTWWQQVTGEAILGPLKGKRLKSVFHDELTYQLWKQEQPGGRVLRPDDTSEWKEFSENWEEETGKMPVVTKSDDNDVLAPRTIVIGLSVNGEAKAYPLAAIEKQKLVVDTLGGVPVIILLNEDGKSVRAFEALIDGRKAEFFIKPESSPQKLTDSLTGSEWEFNGRAVAGEFANRELKKIPLLKDYWFDWKIYNPRTQVYTLGAQ